MKTVFQAEYLGDLAPYDYESEVLGKVGAALRVARCTDGPDLIAQARDAAVIWLEWTPHLTAGVLAQLENCELVMRWGVGYDQIDVQAATALGIAVANAPSYCTEDVAEHAMALMLAVSRQVVARHEQMRAGLWRSGSAPFRRLEGSTVAVIGLGRIGRRVAQLSAAFGARVLGFDAVSFEVPGVHRVRLEQALGEADFISLHVPLSPQTHHLVNRETLKLLKRTAVIINTSRGGIIDQTALIEALGENRLAGAALDVFEEEPLPPDHPLRQLPAVVLTPHEAANSPQSLADLRREMCQATVEWLTTGWTNAVVNPEVRARLRRGQANIAKESRS